MRITHRIRVLSLIAVAPLIGADGCDGGSGTGAAPGAGPLVLSAPEAWTPWSTPVLVEAVNSAELDANPVLSHDELSLYFSSARDGGQGGTDIWVAHRDTKKGAWNTPVNLGSAINTAGDDQGLSISKDGRMLFFVSDRITEGEFDLYASFREENESEWGASFNLGTDVNTTANELSPHFQIKGEGGEPALYFARGGDIYWAPMTKDGELLGTATALAEVNSASPDFGPTVRPDGLEMMIQSGRTGGVGGTDIWVSTRASVHDPWSTPENLGTPVNTTVADISPAISFDGRTLLFAAAAARGGQGGQEIWISTRAPLDDEDED